MRFIVFFAFSLVAVLSRSSADEAGFAQPIPEVKLTNGTVFRNVTVLRYNPTSVVLKSSAGAGPILYTYIPEPLRSQMLAARDDQVSKQRREPSDAQRAQTTESQTFTGEIFVVTKGRTNVKLGDATITAYPLAEALSALEFSDPKMPRSYASSTTNKDGEFTITLKPDQLPALFVVAEARLVAGSWENYIWRVSTESVDEQHHLVLSNSNMASVSAQHFRVLRKR